MPNRRPRLGVTLIEILVVLAILAVLMALILPAVQRVREAANRARCVNNLRQIGVALQSYHNTYSTLPPGVSYEAGRSPFPFMAWSARLLPFLEQDPLWTATQQAYAQDKTFWDDPPHTGLATVLPIYACPSDARTANTGVGHGIRVAFTSYLGVSGNGQFRKNGLLFLDSAVRFADITDGASNTICVGERPPSANLWYGWWYAGVGQDNGGSLDSILSVRARRVNSQYGMGCPPGPYEFGPGRVTSPCDVYHFWSLHLGGGAHFLFADGSVHFLTYGGASVLPALASRAGGEAVSLPD